MKKILLVLIPFLFMSCGENVGNYTRVRNVGNKVFPETVNNLKVYNGSGCLKEFDNCKIKTSKILNTGLAGSNQTEETWLVYEITGTDKEDKKLKTVKVLDCDSLTLVWE